MYMINIIQLSGMGIGKCCGKEQGIKFSIYIYPLGHYNADRINL